MSILIPSINSCIAFCNVMGGEWPPHMFKWHWYQYNDKADAIPMSTPRAMDKVRRALKADQRPFVYAAPSVEEFASYMSLLGVDTTYAHWGSRTPNVNNVIPLTGMMLGNKKAQVFLSVNLLEDGPYSFNWQVQRLVKGQMVINDNTFSELPNINHIPVMLLEHVMVNLEVTDIP